MKERKNGNDQLEKMTGKIHKMNEFLFGKNKKKPIYKNSKMAWIFQNVDNNFFCKTKEKGRGNYFPLQMNKYLDR